MRRRPKDRKAMIALAAAELFCVRGFHNVGINDIAGAVGITGPAIYRHFATKEAVLAAAVEVLVDTFADIVATAADRGSPADRLDTATRALVRYALDQRPVARLYQWEGRHLPPEQRARQAARFDTAVRTLRNMVLDTRPELSKQDAATLTAAALSVIASPATHRTNLARTTAENVLGDCVRAVLTSDLPPPGDGRPRRPEHLALLPRRERLLTEAVRLFHQRGYHAVSIADIGRAAGINASSVYAHFTSKAELLAAAYHRATSHLELATTTALTSADTPTEALRRLIETYIRITLEQSDLAAVYVSESENLPPTDHAQLRVAQRRHVDTWVDLVAKQGNDDPPAAIRFRVHAALNVVTDLARAAGNSVTEARIRGLVARLLFSHAAGPQRHGEVG
jgi:AcrR family transcriptional regulator